MKMKLEHYNHLKVEIDKVLIKYPKLLSEYQAGQYPRANKTRDVNRRFCFDILYGAGISKWVCDNLYPYLNDDHIYTALKLICPTITAN